MGTYMSGRTRKAYLARLEQNRLATLEQRGRARRDAFEIAAGVVDGAWGRVRNGPASTG